MMQIYNTQTRRKEEFVPIEPGKVRIYCCGPTVYNYFHIGNARPFIVFDTLRRYLEHKGYGRRRSRANRRGNPRGAWVVRAGILNAPR